jgi:hypothetical protein
METTKIHLYIMTDIMDPGRLRRYGWGLRARWQRTRSSVPGRTTRRFSSQCSDRLRPTKHPNQCIAGSPFPGGVKLPSLEPDHSPPSSAKIKNLWSYTATVPYRIPCRIHCGRVSFIVVFCLNVFLLCVIYVTCLLCPIVVLLPPV